MKNIGKSVSSGDRRWLAGCAKQGAQCRKSQSEKPDGDGKASDAGPAGVVPVFCKVGQLGTTAILLAEGGLPFGNPSRFASFNLLRREQQRLCR